MNTVADVASERGIRATTKRRFVPPTTGSAHERPVVGGVPGREFGAELPDREWVVDVAYVATDEGWLYPAGVTDPCSRDIVGWSMAGHAETSPASDAPRMAIAGRGPTAGLPHHGDRGSQHASGDYTRLLWKHGVEASTGGVGQFRDNAAEGSFRATPKTELAHHERYATRDQARVPTFEYVEVFYNRKRLHRSLGYFSPEQFEASLN